MNITISHPTAILKGTVSLPLSKSESNRILILEALSKGKISSDNISEAQDTGILRSALASGQTIVDIQDAGTAMRFLTAYYGATGEHKILTCSERMCERPIGILVDALRDIGFRIECTKKEGFPPLEIIPSDHSILRNEVHIAGNVSSQFISALMMIAPVLEKGLEITFTTPLSSKPYIALTAALMQAAGIKVDRSADKIHIRPQTFKEIKLDAGADWSSAGYWFSMAALATEAEIHLSKLSLDSYQGDKQIAEWCKYFNVKNSETSEGLLLHCAGSGNLTHRVNPANSGLYFDFTDYPDLAQTVMVLCAAKNIKATFTGMQSLRIKETDRIAAMQNELLKFGVRLEEFSEGKFRSSGRFYMSGQTVSTYHDHRMAMAFAPLAVLGTITIEDAGVVEKSYPSFWEEMKKAGFEIE